MTRTVHPIESESYRRLRAAVDLSHLPPLSRAVTERVIHASADLHYRHDLLVDEAALRHGWRALHDGAAIVVDAHMVGAGITQRDTICGLGVGRPRPGETRSAAGLRAAAEQTGDGAVYVIGTAPTALFALLELNVMPALVIGLPVGFVDAAESKQALRDSGLPAVSNRSAKGGSAVAAAALNALLYAEPVP